MINLTKVSTKELYELASVQDVNLRNLIDKELKERGDY